MRCPGCGRPQPAEVPYERVRVIEVVHRDAGGVPDQFREYRLEPAAGRAGRAGGTGLGEPVSPGGVPESLGERAVASGAGW